MIYYVVPVCCGFLLTFQTILFGCLLLSVTPVRFLSTSLLGSPATHRVSTITADVGAWPTSQHKLWSFMLCLGLQMRSLFRPTANPP